MWNCYSNLSEEEKWKKKEYEQCCYKNLSETEKNKKECIRAYYKKLKPK